MIAVGIYTTVGIEEELYRYAVKTTKLPVKYFYVKDEKLNYDCYVHIFQESPYRYITVKTIFS